MALRQRQKSVEIVLVFSVSRLPVGSSARMSDGSLPRAEIRGIHFPIKLDSIRAKQMMLTLIRTEGQLVTTSQTAMPVKNKPFKVITKI
jgi:hypothetical protein